MENGLKGEVEAAIGHAVAECKRARFGFAQHAFEGLGQIVGHLAACAAGEPLHHITHRQNALFGLKVLASSARPASPRSESAADAAFLQARRGSRAPRPCFAPRAPMAPKLVSPMRPCRLVAAGLHRLADAFESLSASGLGQLGADFLQARHVDQCHRRVAAGHAAGRGQKGIAVGQARSWDRSRRIRSRCARRSWTSVQEMRSPFCGRWQNDTMAGVPPASFIFSGPARPPRPSARAKVTNFTPSDGSNSRAAPRPIRSPSRTNSLVAPVAKGYGAVAVDLEQKIGVGEGKSQKAGRFNHDGTRAMTASGLWQTTLSHW